MSASIALKECLSVERSIALAAADLPQAHTGRELVRNLWLALGCLFCFAWFRECPSYCGYLSGMLVEPVRLSFWGEVSFIWIVLAKSAQALLPIVPVSLWLAHRGRERLGRYMLSGWVSLLALWLFVDQIVFVITSHHVVEYLGLVVNRDAWQWAGESSRTISMVVSAGCFLLLVVCGLFEIVAWLDRVWFRSGRVGRQGWLSFGGIALLLMVVLGWPLPRVGLSNSDVRLLNHLERNLAWRPVFCQVDHSSGLAAKTDLKDHASQAYANVKLQLSHQPLDSHFRIATTERRHVVCLILESFRRDLIASDAMPFCEKLSHDGLFLERHYSNSNMSHYGLFSLLYGRQPFLYDELLDRGVKSQASELFRNSGYRNTFITSGDCSNWLRMGEFLGRDSFDEVLVLKQPSWVDRDRQALSRVAELLKADANEQPQFVVCFLMSTHFPYEFPADHKRFEPFANTKDVLAAQNPNVGGDPAAMQNRQKNAAHFLDAEIQHLVKSVDRSQTTLVVTGDHAESFKDDGCFFHGSRLSDTQTMVPALIWGAGVPTRKISQMTAHVDVLPTLCSLLTGGRGVPDHLHGRNVLELNPDSLEQVLLTHGRMTSRDLFQRMVLVSPEWRLPMLLHTAKGAGITLLDPVDRMDRTLPSQDFSAASLREFSHRFDVAFRSLNHNRLVSGKSPANAKGQILQLSDL